MQVISPYQHFFDSNGSPLDNGYIYIGTEGLDPESSPQAVYLDKSLSIPVSQPIRTLNGYPVSAGSPAVIYTAQDGFSITVRNSASELVYSSLSVLPSDSLIESGTNINGYYEKYSSGLMICRISTETTDQAISSAYGTLFTGTRSWTFPAEFISFPSVSPGIGKWGTAAAWSTVAQVGTSTSVTIRFIDTSSRASGTLFNFSALAIGRWF